MRIRPLNNGHINAVGQGPRLGCSAVGNKSKGVSFREERYLGNKGDKGKAQ